MIQPGYSNPSMTPTDVDQRRKLAQALMQQGTDASPVGHWTQGLARVLQGGMGGYYGRTASDAEKEGIASRGAFMSQAMKDPAGAAASGIGSAWTTDMAGNIGQKVIGQKLEQSDPMYQLRRQQAQADLEMVPLKRQAIEADIAGKGLMQRKTEAELEQVKRQTPQWRMQNAEMFGIQKNTPAWQSFVINGTLPSAGDYGKAGAVFQGPDGKFYTAQFGSDGTRKIEPITANGQALEPAKGVKTVDTADGTRIISGASGADVRQIDKNIAGAEQAKVEGRERGETIANRTKAETAIAQLEAKQQNVVQIIDRALPEVNRLTAGFGGTLLSKVPGTAAADLARLVDTVKANVGFDALQGMRDASPTGGALGGIAVQELQMLQAVVASLEQSQSPAQLRDNLVKVRQTIEQMKAIRRQAFDKTYPQQAAPPAPATNIQNRRQLPSGKWAVQIDGQWYEE